ncbi:MAG: zinc ribbon domain-containing protein [Paenibacillus sp.]|uniref:zinc ribbon domain-containing protein n=1 Tax=Paenibacillus sp. TaxID=58172 RepID=UPI00290790E2|nr:zinc ribbon domain-containing protein [Paenibacillus sp.]MDU4697229.1 zinc ribbon domain-containing protein [Paenibacillus sp.]
MYCTYCGKILYEGDRFCANCGTPPKTHIDADNLLPSQHITDPFSERIRNTAEFGVSEEDLRQFVGPRTEVYLQKWREDSRWNWPAFVLGGYWLLYRGMYLYLLLYLVAGSLVINLAGSLLYAISGNTFSGGIVAALFTICLAIRIGLAISANTLYLSHARRKINALYQRYPSDNDTREEKIAQAGETSLYIPIALAVLPLLISLVFGAFTYLHYYKQIQTEIRQLQQ